MQTAWDDAVERETNGKELRTTAASEDSLDVSKEVAECDTEGITATKIALGTEILDSASEVKVEDDASKSTTSEAASDDDNVVVSTATDAGQESCIITSVDDESSEVAAEAESGTGGGTVAEPDTQDVEERSENVSGVTDHDEQSEHVG